MTQQSNRIGFFGAISEARKWVLLVLIGLVLFFGYKFFTGSSENTTVEYDTNLIQQQIKNVGKLVVTEGHFAEVMNYTNKRETYIPGLTFDKKAIVIINADVTVGFDLSQVKYDIDAKSKILTITNIPEEEIKISPDIKYYNTESSSFNEFKGEDYNKINQIAKANLAKKIEKSTLKSNAKNRLVSELSKILILTNSMGWKLQYQGQTIGKESDFKLNH
jgi:hypothetical protein